jgi:hypothetical protein
VIDPTSGSTTLTIKDPVVASQLTLYTQFLTRLRNDLYYLGFAPLPEEF